MKQQQQRRAGTEVLFLLNCQQVADVENSSFPLSVHS